MKTIEQQMEQILSRAEKLREGRRLRRQLRICAGSLTLTLSLLILMWLWMPGQAAGAETSAVSNFGSLILGTPLLGRVLTCLLCFALGAETLLLCLLLRRWKERGRK